MNLFERQAVQAQTFVDYNEYFEYKYNDFFIKSAWGALNVAMDFIKHPQPNTTISIEAQNAFFSALIECLKHIDLLITEKPKPRKLKDKLLFKIYKLCQKKLQSKGLI